MLWYADAAAFRTDCIITAPSISLQYGPQMMNIWPKCTSTALYQSSSISLVAPSWWQVIIPWLPLNSIISNLRSSGEQGWRKGQAVSDSLLLHSFPLQQNWMQTLLGKSQEKFLLILIFRLCSQKMPMSDWAHFTVSLVTARHCFFLALAWGWLCATFRGCGAMLISCKSMGCLVTMRSGSEFALVVGFWSQIVGSGKCLRARVVAGVSLVPRIQSVGFDGGCNVHNGCPEGLVQDDVILKYSHFNNGMDQRLNVKLWNRTILCCNVHVTTVGSEVGNMIEDFLKKGVAMPQWIWGMSVWVVSYQQAC